MAEQQLDKDKLRSQLNAMAVNISMMLQALDRDDKPQRISKWKALSDIAVARRQAIRLKPKK